MSIQPETRRLDDAVAQLSAYCRNPPAAEVVDRLTAGLTQLRDSLEVRIHEDVEQNFGVDSMISPMSLSQLERQARRTKIEIDAYAAILVDNEATRGGYVDDPGAWFLKWIFGLRFGDDAEAILEKRGALYRDQSADERRLKFVSMLQHVAPESIKTPLVLFRLFPRAVRIVAATAFGDAARSLELRAEQIELLPPIGDCHECRGRVLGNEERCRCCGNPIWTFAWLRSD